jgi:hypothetical protein
MGILASSCGRLPCVTPVAAFDSGASSFSPVMTRNVHNVHLRVLNTSTVHQQYTAASLAHQPKTKEIRSTDAAALCGVAGRVRGSGRAGTIYHTQHTRHIHLGKLARPVILSPVPGALLKHLLRSIALSPYVHPHLVFSFPSSKPSMISLLNVMGNHGKNCPGVRSRCRRGMASTSAALLKRQLCTVYRTGAEQALMQGGPRFTFAVIRFSRRA